MWTALTLKDIIEKNESGPGRVFDLSIQALILISLVTFAMETLPSLSATTRAYLNVVETVIVSVFTIEYLLRIIVAEKKLTFIFSFYGLIDLLAILPFYVAKGIDLRSIRVFRLLRLARAFKLLRFSRAMKRFRIAFGMIRAELVLFFMTSSFVIYVASVGIYYFEHVAQPDKFSSVFHSMWWAVSTLTTVGYGDLYPITVGGKLFTFVILLVGLGMVAVPTGLISSALTETLSEEANAD
jgi:voltage-gated potassium channel